MLAIQAFIEAVANALPAQSDVLTAPHKVFVEPVKIVPMLMELLQEGLQRLVANVLMAISNKTMRSSALLATLSAKHAKPIKTPALLVILQETSKPMGPLASAKILFTFSGLTQTPAANLAAVNAKLAKRVQFTVQVVMPMPSDKSQEHQRLEFKLANANLVILN